jgi:hypothetical protein
LAYYARQAHRDRKNAITVGIILDENGIGSSLTELLRTLSTVLVVPTDAPLVQGTDAQYVYTWRSFRIIQVLAKRALQPHYRCAGSLPRRLSLASDEVAIPLVEGTALVDGVAVTMDSSESHVTFKPGQQYLMLAFMCPGGVVVLPQGHRDIFEVTTNGRIVSTAEPQSRFMEELLDLGTIDHLVDGLRRVDDSGGL